MRMADPCPFCGCYELVVNHAGLLMCRQCHASLQKMMAELGKENYGVKISKEDDSPNTTADK